MLTNWTRLRENEEAFNRYKIRPRVLRNVSQIDTSAEIFGYKVRGRQMTPCGDIGTDLFNLVVDFFPVWIQSRGYA